MPSTSRPTRKPRAFRRRMALPALLIFAPLAVLTAIGLRGVATTRRAAREAAQTETSRWIDQALERLQSGYQNLLQSSHTPELYPLSPTPAARNEAQSLYAQALTLPGPEALPLFSQIETQYAEAATNSGIPLLPLAEWAKLQRSSDSAKMREVAEDLGRAAVETHPSILTPELLGRAEDFLRARALDPGELTHWRQRWDDDERLRGILRAHETALSSGFPGAWIEADSERWWLASDPPNHQVVLLAKSQFRDIAGSALSAVFALRPAYASVEITFHGERLWREPVGGERLVEAARSGFDALGMLAHPNVLYAAQRQQVIWLSTLLACAVGAAAAGYFSLQHALLRERQLHELKSNFVASVSHELRAPVASMRVMAENLGSGIVPGEARQKEYHRLIAEECGRLSTLIENVLDLARIEQGRKTYRFLETDVRAMIEDAV
ncbi:MAG TPA: histidine kinase dimerization/phospho-acceptor domain-containing protein, partial [Chthoniobacteraceae bacterium]